MKRPKPETTTKSVFKKLLAALILVVFLAITAVTVVKKDIVISLFASKQIEAVSDEEWVGGTYTFSYTGNYQEFVVPVTGKYKLEVWGAQGGYRSNSANGGKGGYSTGEISLKKGETIYIYVGGSGNTGGNAGGYNGGGTRTLNAGGGGGATDIRIGGNSLYHRVIVAGGGGSDGASNKPGKFGGGATGGSATESYGNGGAGATTTAAGAHRGTFGIGGSGLSGSNGHAGAGGGGWYGGGGANPDGSADDDRGGGGGSGFVYDGSIATPEGYAVSSEYILRKAQMIAGNQSMPTYDGSSTMTGNSGNGYAKITISEYFDFDYTGTIQEFIAPVTGTYMLETWGAQGADMSTSYLGGKGGYSTGKIELTKGDILYIVVGGTTTTKTGGYNGGGTGKEYTGGGGATHIATKTGLLKSLSSNKDSILIVAGGGGGAGHTGTGGAGGGTSGIAGSSTSGSYGRGGTQTTAGYNAGFGYGGADYRHGGGGGGGYYGGGGRR